MSRDRLYKWALMATLIAIPPLAFSDAGQSLYQYVKKGASLYDSAGVLRIGIPASGSTTIKSTTPDSVNATATVIDTSVSFVSSNTKLMSIRNNTVEKSFFDSSGGLIATNAGATIAMNRIRSVPLTAAGLATCQSSSEGLIQTIAAIASTSASRLCVCKGDATTPVYVWRNLITGTDGTATTCP